MFVDEIIKEIENNSNIAMLLLGKSAIAPKDNEVLPRVASYIGNKIKIPVLIVPENLTEDDLGRLAIL